MLPILRGAVDNRPCAATLHRAGASFRAGVELPDLPVRSFVPVPYFAPAPVFCAPRLRQDFPADDMSPSLLHGVRMRFEGLEFFVRIR